MTEKNIFGYKLFCHEILESLLCFLCKTSTPPEKRPLPFFQQTPLKKTFL